MADTSEPRKVGVIGHVHKLALTAAITAALVGNSSESPTETPHYAHHGGVDQFGRPAKLRKQRRSLRNGHRP